MSLILNINTDSELAIVSLADNSEVLAFEENEIAKDHASFVHTAIKSLLLKTNLSLSAIEAVAVSGGPGSYTGIRVGMASAKGLCFALNVPLIMIGSLNLLAADQFLYDSNTNFLYAPVIDARRMEVYTTIIDRNENIFLEAQPMVLGSESFSKFLDNGKVLFMGNGIVKLQPLIIHKNAYFAQPVNLIDTMAILSANKFRNHQFNDLINSEPLYLKGLYVPDSKIK